MISVIIPVYNGEKQIADCLESLKTQNRKPNEIIVIDDGSKDGTKKVVKKFRNVRLIEKEHGGPAAARNLGAREAKGDILLFTDSDCMPDKDWVSEMMRPFEDKDVIGVQGRYRNNQKEMVARFAQLEIEERYDRMRKRKQIDFIGSYSAGYRKDAFLRHGGFDESFSSASGEDTELSFKLAKAGFKMVFNEKAVVYHKHVDSLPSYLRQKFWRAYWRILLYSKHPDKIKDESYTPNSLKMQIFFMYMATLFAFSIPFINYASLFFSLSVLLMVISTLPLSFKNLRKDFLVGIFTPVISIMRTFVFSLGLIYGVIRR